MDKKKSPRFREWPKFYRQGDILLEKIEEGSKRDDTPDLRPAGASIEVAQGETTGHAHVLHGAGMHCDSAHEPSWVRLDHPATLKHEEHAPIPLEPGLYRIRRQRRYAWPEDRPGDDAFLDAYD